MGGTFPALKGAGKKSGCCDIIWRLIKIMKMVDISKKETQYREATAVGLIRLKKETIQLIKNKMIEKGDPISASSISAMIGAKKTPELLPFTHNIELASVETSFEILEDCIKVIVTVKAIAKTGVEMEALVATAVALLNIWDMVKKYEKNEEGQYPFTEITQIKVLNKQKIPLE